ncbi:S24 family peptidase [Flammeovirga sp. OC4]|uniref:S24 family peptidase n=1 Tax=Flammeovirga sp. OC4 TaxID=1382345 RepID=UPI0005C534B2|nr:S24 family peptidase [Flammeovirga sp. OC4]
MITENNTSISLRIKQFIDNQDITINRFSKEVGASNSYFNKLFKNNGSIGSDKIENILRAFPEINPTWLLTGCGNMLLASTFQPQGSFKMETEVRPISTGTPLIPTHAFAGMAGGDVSIMEKDINEYYNVPDFTGVDFMIRVKGSSMYPKYNSGDIVACKKLNNTNIIQWGKTYVMYIRDQGTLVKRLFPSEESKMSVKIVSDNDKYPPFDVSKDEILSLALVTGVIRME